MFRSFVICFFSLCCVHMLCSQQRPQWSSFYENGFIWNPALTAKWAEWEVSATHRKEWVDFDRAPEYSSLAFQFPFTSKVTRVSMGAIVERDKVGPFSNLGMGLSYAYRVIPRMFGNEEDALRLGLMARMSQSRYNPDGLTLFGQNGDPRLIDAFDSRSLGFNVNVGVFYMSVSDIYKNISHYYFGLSANNFSIGNGVNVEGVGTIKQAMHATAHLGYRYYPLRKSHFFEPNVLVDYSYSRAISVIANCRYENPDAFWLSFGYVSSNEIFAQAGVILDKYSFLSSVVNQGMLRIGVKADYALGSIGNYAGIGYEAYVAYVFDRRK